MNRFSPRLCARLRDAVSVVAFTGAGISAESGVPTFRGVDGFWKGMKPEDLATPQAFLQRPARVWEWYAYRKTVLRSVQPNAGHVALARMEQVFPHVAVVTQNIDNLHQRAGSTVVHELHGTIERNYCLSCGKAHADAEVECRDGVPLCRACGGLVRPAVVWFGEPLPEDAWEAAVKASSASDLMLSIGTSSLVYPAASLPRMARRSGALLVEINVEPTPLTDMVDEFLQGSSGTILPELLSLARHLRCPAP